MRAGANEAKVLAQRTRAQLIERLGELGGPVSTARLADALGLHRNGVRLHLERLEQAGLVRRERQTGARGRPPDLWSLTARGRAAGGSPERYRELGRWLARALASPRRGLRGIEETGREIGRELAAEDVAVPGMAAHLERSPDTVLVLTETLARLGFQPSAKATAPGRVDICLGNCPYRDAVHENQPAICTLHRGITAGLLDRVAPAARLRSFVPADPDEAGCTISVGGLAPAIAGAAGGAVAGAARGAAGRAGRGVAPPA